MHLSSSVRPLHIIIALLLYCLSYTGSCRWFNIQVTEKVKNYLWLTNFRVLWDAPDKDDPWVSVANYDIFISECCRMYVRGGSMGIWGKEGQKSGTMVVSDCSDTWSLREAQQRESVWQWHWEDSLPLDASWASWCTNVVTDWKHHIGTAAEA